MKNIPIILLFLVSMPTFVAANYGSSREPSVYGRSGDAMIALQLARASMTPAQRDTSNAYRACQCIRRPGESICECHRRLWADPTGCGKIQLCLVFYVPIFSAFGALLYAIINTVVICSTPPGC